MEKRKSKRYDIKNITGKLYNVVKFEVKDLSLEGIKIISNFQPKVGGSYLIYINDGKEDIEFKINVIRAEVESFEKAGGDIFTAGIHYSIGAIFEDLESAKEQFLQSLIQMESDKLEAGFLSEKKPSDDNNQEST